jgi:hypothetical protein
MDAVTVPVAVVQAPMVDPVGAQPELTPVPVPDPRRPARA